MIADKCLHHVTAVKSCAKTLIPQARSMLSALLGEKYLLFFKKVLPFVGMM
jgi:hypothetical protein